MKKRTKRLLTLVSAAGASATAAGFVAGNYFYKLAMVPHTDKTAVLNAPHNKIDWGSLENRDRSADNRAWMESVGYETTSLLSFDGLKLNGYIIENEMPTNRWAVLVHGYGSNAFQMARIARQFYNMGFHLLLPDARGHGLSEGGYNGMGWHDRLDVVDWCNRTVAKHPDAEIVLYGISKGAATVMMAAGEKLPKNVKAIVEDCGYSSVWDEFSYQLEEIFGLPSFPVMNFASGVTKLRAGWFLGEGDAVRQVSKSRTPILFIHGDADTFVPAWMLDAVYDAAGGEKEKLLVAGAGHGAAASVAGDVYWQTVAGFLDRYLLEKIEYHANMG